MFDEEAGRVILIESKAKRILAETRFSLPKELFDSNLSEAFNALLKLPKKWGDLRAGIPEYEDIQDSIDACADTPPICVVIQSEAVYSQGEIVRHMARAFGDHPLNEYPYPYCILGLDQFELAVEASIAQVVPLSILLENHYNESIMSGKTSAVDEFGHVTADTTDWFSTRFLRKDREHR